MKGRPFSTTAHQLMQSQNSVPVLESEESYVSHLLLKSVKKVSFGEKVCVSISVV